MMSTSRLNVSHNGEGGLQDGLRVFPAGLPGPAMPPHPSSLISICCVLTALLPTCPAFPSLASTSMKLCPLRELPSTRITHSYPTSSVPLLVGTNTLCSLFLCPVFSSTGIDRLPGSGLHMSLDLQDLNSGFPLKQVVVPQVTL